MLYVDTNHIKIGFFYVLSEAIGTRSRHFDRKQINHDFSVKKKNPFLVLMQDIFCWCENFSLRQVWIDIYCLNAMMFLFLPRSWSFISLTAILSYWYEVYWLFMAVNHNYSFTRSYGKQVIFMKLFFCKVC